MAANTPLGMEFANWQNVPSISETFAKTSQGQFNPLAALIGAGISQFTGDNKLTQGLQGQGAQLPPTAPATPAPMASPQQPVSGVSGAAVPGAFQLPPLNQPAPTFSTHPLIDAAKQLLGGQNGQ